MNKFILLGVALTLLTACQDAPGGYSPEPFAFEAAAGAPMRFQVGNIRVIEEYQSTARRPFVEQDFPVSPAQASKRWVAARLQAAGGNGVLEMTITDASVKEMLLPKTPGVKGIFTDDQDARYDARLAVTLRLYDGTNTLARATGDVVVTRSRSIHEKATVFERERIYHSMVREMMTSLESEANVRFQQYFSAYMAR